MTITHPLARLRHADLLDQWDPPGFTLAGAWALVATIGTIDIAFRRPTDLAKDR